MRKQSFNISYFICPCCGNSLPLARKKSCKRNKGHIKDLFCVYCNKIVKTVEVRQGDCYVRNNGKVIYG